MECIHTVQSAALIGCEAMGTVSESKEKGDFEGCFSGFESSSKKKIELEDKDSEKLALNFFCLSSSHLPYERPLAINLGTHEESFLEASMLEQGPSTLCLRSLVSAEVLPSSCSEEQSKPKSSLLGTVETKTVSLPEASSKVKTGQTLEAFIQVGSSVYALEEGDSPLNQQPANLLKHLPLSKAIPVDQKIDHLETAPKAPLTSFLKHESPATQEKTAFLSFPSTDQASLLDSKSPLVPEVKFLSENSEESLGLRPSLDKDDSQESISPSPFKPSLKNPFITDINPLYRAKESPFGVYKNAKVQPLGLFKRSLHTHVLDQGIAGRIPLGNSLSYIASSTLNLKPVWDEEGQDQPDAVSRKNSSLNDLDVASALSFAHPPLDVQEAQEMLHDQKMQTDLVGLIADYFDKMKEQGRSWTRLSLHLGPEQKVQLLLRIQGDAVGLRFQDAPQGIDQMLLKQWPHLSRLASKRGLRLEDPSFLQGSISKVADV